MGHDHHEPVADAGIPTDRAVFLLHDSGGATPGSLLHPAGAHGWLGETTPTAAPGHVDGRAAASADGTLYREVVWRNTDDHDRGEWQLIPDSLFLSWPGVLLRLPRIGEIALENADERDPELACCAGGVAQLSRLFRHVTAGLLLPYWFLRLVLVVALAGAARRSGVEMHGVDAMASGQAWPALMFALSCYAGFCLLVYGWVARTDFTPLADGQGQLPHNPDSVAWNGNFLASLFLFAPGAYLVALWHAGAWSGDVAAMHWMTALDGVGLFAHLPSVLCFLGVFALCVYQRLNTLHLDVPRSVWATPALCVSASWLLLEYLLFTSLAAFLLAWGALTGQSLVDIQHLAAHGLIFHGAELGLATLGLAYIALRATGREPGYGARSRCRAINLVFLLAALWLPMHLLLRGPDASVPVALTGAQAGLKLGLLVLSMVVGYLLLIAVSRPLVESVRDMIDYLAYRPQRGKPETTLARHSVDRLREAVDAAVAGGHRRVILVARGQAGVIAYDMLREAGDGWPGARVELLTIGCPLSGIYARFLPESMYAEALQRPAAAAAWHNVWAEGDLFGGELAESAVDDQQSLGWQTAGEFGDAKLASYLRQLIRADVELPEFAAETEPVGAGG